jgi:phage terminase large subunit
MKTIEIPIEYKPLFNTDWREASVYGGRYSMKSHTVARVLLIKARQRKIRVACFREYQNSIADSSHQLLADLIELYEMSDFKVTDKSIINTVTGSDFLFKGLKHNEQNIKSTEGIDIAWIEEAQTVSSRSIEVLTPTVRKPGSQLIYTYNRLLEDDPVHQRLVIEGRPDTLVINANYDIAIKYGMMPENILKEIEDDKKHRPALYKHKWLGEPNLMERKIYKDWNIIDEIPHEARLERYCLDFGYSNDPASIVAIYYYNGGYILNEIVYQKGLNNKQLADILLNQEHKALTVADSAEPKSIDEIKLFGVSITGAIKKAEKTGPKMTYNRWAIGIVQQQKISITKRSVNTIKEYMNYMWDVDKDDKVLNEPIDLWNHSMDAIKYGIISLAPIKRKQDIRKQISEAYSRRQTKQRGNIAI